MSAGGAFPSAALRVAIRNAALSIAPAHARRLAEVLAGHQGPDARARTSALAIAPVPAFRRLVVQVLEAWEAECDVPGAVVGAALCVAVETAESVRATQSVDLVWTGPASAEAPVRLTREVLLEVINGASSSLIIVSYAAYRVPEIIQALGESVSRGIDVRLVLESSSGSRGRLSLDAMEAFRDLASGVRVYEWATDRRVSDRGREGVMHAKAALADDRVAFITSANLTGSAIESNMELGVVIRGGAVPRRLGSHLRSLVHTGCLEEVKNR